MERVHYLGHLAEGDPRHGIYRRQCLSRGGMISFEVGGAEAEAEALRVPNALELIQVAVSVGGIEFPAEHAATMTHADIAPDDQRRMGITPSTIRLSVGVDHPDDLIADPEAAALPTGTPRGRGRRRRRAA